MAHGDQQSPRQLAVAAKTSSVLISCPWPGAAGMPGLSGALREEHSPGLEHWVNRPEFGFPSDKGDDARLSLGSGVRQALWTDRQGTLGGRTVGGGVLPYSASPLLLWQLDYDSAPLLLSPGVSPVPLWTATAGVHSGHQAQAALWAQSFVDGTAWRPGSLLNPGLAPQRR